jgi:hypothetical protein
MLESRRLLFSLLAVSVSWGARADGARWADARHPGFSALVDELAGAGAVDCGFYDLTQNWPADDVVNKAYDCAKRELAAKHPFKYGIFIVHVDAPTTEAVVRSADGRLWHVAFYGSMYRATVEKVVRECPTVKVTPRLPIDSLSCSDMSKPFPKTK